MAEPIIEEIWKSIPGYETLYEVSNLGRIRGIARGRGRRRNVPYLLHPIKHSAGYQQVDLYDGAGNHKRFFLHRLVLIAFDTEIPIGMEVNHKNGVKADARLDNLEVVTRGDNMRHSYSVLGHNRRNGADNGKSKLTDSDVLEIRKMAASGLSQRFIASLFHIDRSAVGKLIRRALWRHLP